MNTIRRTTKSVIRPLVLALALTGVPAAAALSASSATAATASCAAAWGSLDKSSRRAGSATIVSARAGRHACFDRLVIDFLGKGANARVRYLTDIVPGSGLPITLVRGGAILEVALDAHADDVEAVNVSGFTTFREAAFLGSFRGFARFGLGVRAHLPFRVLTLDGPGTGSRLVIDVAHRWSASAAPFCGIRWGSLDKSSGPTAPGRVTSVRAGRHACFDRLVIDFGGKGANADVAYAPRAVEDESGRPLALRGGATMLVTLNARTFDVNTGARTYGPRNPAEAVNVSGFTTLRQVRFEDADIEVVTLFWLGVRARLPFRVFTLDGPGNGSRLVIDVAHRW